MNYPKISIITPSFNQGQFIEETILSVIGQHYPNLEYIIIDGGSTDNTVEVIKKYEQYITWWVSEKDEGQSAAINKGFSKATGEILGWLNSDDMYMPGALHHVALKMEKNALGIYFGNCIHFKQDDGINTWGSWVVSSHRKCLLENSDYIIQPSSFWTNETFEFVGMLREDINFAFDWEWFLRAQKKGVRFTALSKCLSLYRFHEAHKTGTGGNKRDLEVIKVYNEYAPLNANLYLSLVRDKDYFKKRLNRVLLKLTKLLRVRQPDIFLLKLFKGKSYKNYSTDTISQVRLNVV